MFEESKRINLREAFLEEMLSLAEEGNNVVTLDCEVGTATYTTQFGKIFPERHYEMGVAEQNMMGVAAGLASAGVIPFAATFAVFTSMRACEMVRTSICYPRRNVKMIGGYAGLTDGKDGATHHSIEDLAIMRAIPNNVVLVCSDPVMTRKIIRKSAEYVGPVYIRMEYEKVPCVHSEQTEFQIGKGVPLRQGTDVTIATIGPAIIRALEAAEELEKQGVSAEVIDMLSLKPFDSGLLIESVRKTGALVTVEDHNVIGGLASAACEALVNARLNVKYKALAIYDTFTESGETSELRKRYASTAKALRKRLMNCTGRESSMNMTDLKKQAYELRKAVIDMIYKCDSHSGHFGGSLSAAEYIVALYWKILNINPENPQWPERDRVVFSKGHSAPIIYTALAYKGFFAKDVLGTYRNCNGILQGHPDVRKTPGLDTSSGSLGQGLSVALGMALACRHTGYQYNVYCVLSDGELHEGMVWEAMMAASHHEVTNLTAIIDYNRMHVTDVTENVMEIEPLEDKLRSFGWDCVTVNGHDIESILAGFKIREAHADKPFALICRTVKGKGVSFMENNVDWHSNSITKEERDEAIKQLDEAIRLIESSDK